jgi:hypothetical protein
MVVGVDVSSYRVDLAWLDYHPDLWDGQRLKPERCHFILGTSKDHLIDRVRNVRIVWPLDVTEVAIEYPPPRNYATTAALMAVIGAITKSVPTMARVAWPSVREVRDAIESPYGKADSHERLDEIARMKGWNIDEWDEHERDALIACVAWEIILNQQENA